MSKDEIQEFGRQLRALRKSRGLTLEGLAGKCKLHEKFLGELERGESDLKLGSMIKIASGLGLSLGDLFTLVFPRENLTPEGREVLDLVIQVAKGRDKKKILKLKIFLQEIL